MHRSLHCSFAAAPTDHNYRYTVSYSLGCTGLNSIQSTVLTTDFKRFDCLKIHRKTQKLVELSRHFVAFPSVFEHSLSVLLAVLVFVSPPSEWH